jgi:hypothetical protein
VNEVVPEEKNRSSLSFFLYITLISLFELEVEFCDFLNVKLIRTMGEG